ncbi:MAG TPA: EAL domain-containing protein, partial [Holophagaceae bacterium]|nr:EAL domain-containing protein [Holophagaceae bacterium]
ILVGMGVDLSSRKAAEARVAESESRYRLISESMQDLICLHEPDGRYRYVSPSVRDLLGFEPQELIGVDPYTLFHPDDIPAIQASHREALAPGQGHTFVQYRLRRKDGSYVWMETLTRPIRDAEGRIVKLQTSSRDITARRAAEEDRRRAEQRFRHLIENSADGLILGTIDGAITYSSPAASAILGYSEAELAKVDPYVLVHPEDEPRAKELLHGEVAAHPGVPYRIELRLQRKDDAWRWLEITFTNRMDDPSVQALVVNFRDITDRKMEDILETDRRTVLELVAQNTPLEQTLAHLALLLEHQRPGMMGGLMLVSEGRLHVGAAPSLPPEFLAAMADLPTELGNGSCAEAARSGMPVLAANIATHASWANRRDLAQAHKLRAAWSYPIISASGHVLGTLSLYDRSPRIAHDADLELMAMASRLAAVAIEHLELTEQLAHQAQHDALTGLPNRLLFEDRLRQAMGRARRLKHHLAVLYMDLDRFKHINDTLGHGAGDLLLREAAQRLESRTRQSDTLARMGGDEFTLVLTELKDPQDAARVAAKMLEAMRDPFEVDGHELFVSASIGISLFPSDGEEPSILQRCADTAMYRAKEKGRDNFQWFAAEMDILAHERMELEGHLRRAVEHDELYLLYQPQFMADGRLIGFEALMRWRHPVLGTVSPARFIPLAEESGLIVSMGAWALREACSQLARWQAAGHRGIRVAVNVSAVQFKRPDWVDTVRAALEASGIPPQTLELEITESLLLQSATETTANVFHLRDLGVGIAIDDFGTGYSSLSYLHRLPVTTLKIDQSFVRGIGTEIRSDREDAPIVRTIITLAHSLGMEVMAEGVETEAQLQFLKNLGCEGIQGFLLGRPLPIEEAEAVLTAHARPRRAGGKTGSQVKSGAAKPPAKVAVLATAEAKATPKEKATPKAKAKPGPKAKPIAGKAASARKKAPAKKAGAPEKAAKKAPKRR